MSAFNTLIGMSGNVTINGTTYAVENWKVQETNDLQDVTDTGSQGETIRIPGVMSGTLTCSMWWNYVSPQRVNLYPGLLILFVGKIGATSQTYTRYFLIQDFGIENPAKNPVKIDLTALSTGAATYVIPASSASSSSASV